MFDAPIERAITHWAREGRDADGQAVCPRPESVRAMVPRLYAWRTAPESCQVCLAANAVRVRAAVPLCPRCYDERTAREASTLTLRERVTVESRGDVTSTGVSGYSIVFNALSVDLGGFREIITPGAVTRTLTQGTDLLALWNHNADIPIGRISAGTLQIRSDARGLWSDIAMPSTTTREMEAVRLGNVRGQSFAFRAIEDDWTVENNTPIRYVLDMSVSEVSIVTFPAYPSTTVQAARRSVEWFQKVHKTRLAR